VAVGVALAATPSAIWPARATTATAAATAVAGGVVDVTTQLESPGTTAAGTGMVVTAQGEVLTNNHVVRGAIEIRVAVPGGGTYPARIIGNDAAHDVALLQVIGAPGLTPATFGDSSTVAMGDPVSAVGNAGGVGGTPVVTAGKITGLDQSVTVVDDQGQNPEHLHGLLETDAKVVPGDSGGPLVNAAGLVIGMDTASTVDHSDRHAAPDGFAIPINGALAIVHGIEAAAPPG
jgi:S1-C subfamily serine protease